VLATGLEEREEELSAGLAESPRRPIERLLKAENQDRVTAVSPWAVVPADSWDLPPSARQDRSPPADPVLLERKPRELVQATVDEDMAHLDKPTFVRRLAD